MFESGQSEIRNLLLRRLMPDDWQRLRPHLKPVALNVRDVIVEASAPIRKVHFVEHGLLSVIAGAGERQIEIATVGYEGMTGVPVLHGSVDTPHLMIVQVAGSALRIDVDDFKEAVEQSRSLRDALFLYAHALQIQIADTAVVNSLFTIEQRLARWILMCADKVGDVLPFTHNMLATMLGVRRSGVTTTLHILEGEQMIRSTRGLVVVRDRPKLVERAAGSYGLPQADFSGAMGQQGRQEGDAATMWLNKRILIVEDEYELAVEMQQAFEEMGATVVGPISNIRDALSMLTTTPSLDAAIVDINLQGEMAFIIAETLQKLEVPFVFVSGYQSDIVPKQFSNVKFYEKPAALEDIAVGLQQADRPSH